VPIKASSINSKPTLDTLEKRFSTNELAKEPFKQRIKDLIDDALALQTSSIKNLIEELQKQHVYTVLRQNAEGRFYGITFVDNQHKCVFNGSDIGKQYSAAALQGRINNAAIQVNEKDFHKTINHRKNSHTISRRFCIYKSTGNMERIKHYKMKTFWNN